MNKNKFLIVEDEAIVALNLSNLVRRLGYDVVKVVDTGELAVQATQNYNPDLILMDVRLKGDMTGTEAARIIRQFSDVAIVFLTAYSDESTFQNAMGTQSYGYIIKPFDERQLHIAIQIELHKRQVDRKLRWQSKQLRQIVNSVPEGIVLIDKDRNIQHINSYAVEYVEVIKDTIFEGKVLDEYVKTPHFAELIQTTAHGSWHEVTITEPNYQVFELQVCLSMIETADFSTQAQDESTGWILIIRDQTRQKLANQRISQQEKLATIGRMAAGIAHDFNNILASITIQTDLMLLKSDGLPDYHKMQLKKNKKGLKRAKQLVSQILDFGRTSTPDTKETELGELLKESIDLFGSLLPASVQLDLDLISDSCRVDVNKTLIIQVFMNLILNARDAISSEGGNIRIALRKVKIRPDSFHTDSNDWACVTIEDSGIGMTEDVAQHLFEPFFTTKFAHGGTGLGLAQVYGIMQQHNGFIDFTSKVNEGTKFTIYLPLVNTQENTSRLHSDKFKRDALKRILVVEDDIPARETLCEVLQIANYNVVSAGNGREALDVIMSYPPFEIVLSDINMPDMNGIELYKALIEKGYDTSFGFMTGYVADEKISKVAIDKNNVLKKPFSVDELYAFLDTLESEVGRNNVTTTS